MAELEPIRYVATLLKEHSTKIDSYAALEVFPDTFRVIAIRPYGKGNIVQEFSPQSLGFIDSEHLHSVLALWLKELRQVGIGFVNSARLEFGHVLNKYTFSILNAKPIREELAPIPICECFLYLPEQWPNWAKREA